MEQYYRHFRNGKIYRLLHIATVEASPNEQAVIYQAMYDDGKVWMRPYENFFETVTVDGEETPRFIPIPENKALNEIPPYLSPKYHFPDIPYSNEFPPLVRPGAASFSASVAGMMSLMRNKGVVNGSFFDGLESDDDIERRILQLVVSFKDGDCLQAPFHLIEAWGGMAGRAIYNRAGAWNPDLIMSEYKKLVSTCLNMTRVDEESIDRLVQVIDEFGMNVKHMGVAFITKHVRFWLYRTLRENTLPIYDSIMASTVMGKSAPAVNDVKEYWTAMKSKADHLGIGLMALERQIFIDASRKG